MPKILEIIKKYGDTSKTGVPISFWESPDFVKELTSAVEELYNVGVQNGKLNAKDLIINFLNT